MSAPKKKKIDLSLIQITKYTKNKGKRKNSGKIEFIYSSTKKNTEPLVVRAMRTPGSAHYKNGQMTSDCWAHHEFHKTNIGWWRKEFGAKKAIKKYYGK